MSKQQQSGKTKRHSKSTDRTSGRDEESELTWELALLHTRRLGQRLRSAEGSDARSVKKLASFLRDGRAASEATLRRNVVEALVPAARIGNRAALAAQADALTDHSEGVRKVAVAALKESALGKRPEKGSSVAVALAKVFPPSSAAEKLEVRRAAAEALRQLGPQNDPNTIQQNRAWLEDVDAAVRLSATNAVPLIGADEEDAASLAARLTDSDWRVATAAVRSLESVALERSAAQQRQRRRPTSSSTATSKSAFQTPGTPDGGTSERSASHASTSGSTTFGTAGGLESKGPRAVATAALAEVCAGKSSKLLGLPRVEAIAALGRVARLGDVSALQAAADRLADVDMDVRRAASDAIAQIARGDPRTAIEASFAKLDHQDFRVRAAAREALCASVEPEDEIDALGMTTALLDREDWHGRRGVGATLKQLGLQHYGIERALQALERKLVHWDWSVRRKAIESYAMIAEAGGGSYDAMRALAALAHDDDAVVRLEVASVFPRVAPRKCKEAIGVLTPLAIGDPEVDVRCRAVASIALLAAENRSRSRTSIATIGSCLEDEDEAVREAAAKAMHAVGNGRRCAVDAVTERLRHESEKVRKAAVQAFEGVLGCNHDQALRDRVALKLIPFLQHDNADVRRTVASAISAFSVPQNVAAPEVTQPPTDRRAASALAAPPLASISGRGAFGRVQVGGASASVLASAPAPVSACPPAPDVALARTGPDPAAVIAAAAAVVAKFRPICVGPPGGAFSDCEDGDDDRSVAGASVTSKSSRGGTSSASQSTLRGIRNKSNAAGRSVHISKQSAASVNSSEDGTRGIGKKSKKGRARLDGPLKGDLKHARDLESTKEEEEEERPLSESDTDEDEEPKAETKGEGEGADDGVAGGVSGGVAIGC